MTVPQLPVPGVRTPALRSTTPPLPPNARAVSGGLLSVLLILPLAFGCSGEPDHGLVEGRVTLDGKPLAKMLVVFVPILENGTRGQRSAAVTDADGRYALRNDAGRDGVAVGTHRVCVYDLLTLPKVEMRLPPGMSGKEVLPPSKEERSTRPSRIPPVYTDVINTPLQPVEIAHGTQAYDISIKSR